MRARAPGQEREQDGSGSQGMLQGCANPKTMKKRGEIDVFDAGRYFAEVENQRLRMKGGIEMEDELDIDEEGKSADADGDLPLSPLPHDFCISGKASHHTKQNQRKQDDAEAHHAVYAGPLAHTQGKIAVAHTQGARVVTPVRRQTTSIDRSVMPNGGPLAAMSHSANPPPQVSESAPDMKLQGKRSSGNKPQPSSPSMRLTSFLSKFKILSESKSKPHSTAPSTSSMAPSTSSTAASSGQQAITPPKSFFSSLPYSNGKSPSPRGRFLRVLSSSSSQSNPLLKPISKMHHHGAAVAVSTPVSPAGSDPYSPITHSASTTPSRKNPRSRPRSHVPTSPHGSLDWRRDSDNASSRSLTAHLPFIRRKLRAYLMPESSKSSRQQQEDHTQQQGTRDNQETRMGAVLKHDHHRHHQPINGHRSGQSNHDHHHHDNDNGDKQQRAGSLAMSADKKQLVSEHSMSTPPAALQDRHNRHHKANFHMRSPARRAPTGKDTINGQQLSAGMKDMVRRRGDWTRRRPLGEEVEDDIEVAERLLRVVKEHQSAFTTHQPYVAANHINMKGNRRQQSKGFVEQGSGLVVENGAGAARKSRKSSSISPFSSPARYSNSKEEYACPYDSDSSSDLFEIETLQAFSHVAGLYRPRDLPVYDNNSLTKSPLHSSK